MLNADTGDNLTAHNWHNEKVHSLHVPAITFIGKKKLV